MRTIGWILGGIFLVDGLIALVGGKKAFSWLDSKVTPRFPKNWRGTIHELSSVDDTIRNSMGVNQMLAATGILLATLGAAGRAGQEASKEQAQAA